MTVESALLSARRAAESRMTSRATVKRSGDTTTDPDSGFEGAGWATTHTDLPCLVSDSGRGTSGTRTVTVGDVESQVALRVLKVPASTGNIADGDVFYISAGETAGHYFQVLEGTPADQKKQRELAVFEVSKPGGWD